MGFVRVLVFMQQKLSVVHVILVIGGLALNVKFVLIIVYLVLVKLGFVQNVLLLIYCNTVFAIVN